MKEKVLVFGGDGLVGSRFITLNQDRFEFIAPNENQVDVLNFDQLKSAFESSKSSLVVNFVGYTNVDGAEKQKNLAHQLNVTAVENLAKLCLEDGRHLVHISTAYVFSGRRSSRPYKEDDYKYPLDEYARTKLEGEKVLTGSNCSYTIARIDMPYCAEYSLKKDFFRFFLNSLREGKQVRAVSDQRITPIFIDDLASALALIIESRNGGIYHIAPPDVTTPADFAAMVADKFGFDGHLVTPVTLAEFNKMQGNGRAARPKNTWMDSSKFLKQFGKNILHTTEEALDLLKGQLA